jgi:hypothetical protein
VPAPSTGDNLDVQIAVESAAPTLMPPVNASSPSFPSHGPAPRYATTDATKAI